MRLSLRESNYPEYRALREQSSSWAYTWVLGQGLLFVAMMAAFAGTFGVGLVIMIDPEIGSERAWSAATAAVGCAIFYGVIGFLLKRCAERRGKRSYGSKTPRI